jgi:hypothetical protein
MRRLTAGRAAGPSGPSSGTSEERSFVRVLPMIALASLAACASEVPGPLTGRYEGTAHATVFSRPPGLPFEEPARYPYSLDVRHTDEYLDGTIASGASRSRVYGSLSGTRITACAWSAGDGYPCPASWSAEVTGSGAPGTVLEGRVCNNRLTTACSDFRLVKQ